MSLGRLLFYFCVRDIFLLSMGQIGEHTHIYVGVRIERVSLMILWFFYVCGLEEIIDNHNEFEAHVKILGNNVYLFNTMHNAHPEEVAFDKAKACCELMNRVDDVVCRHKLQHSNSMAKVSPEFDRATAKRQKISEPMRRLVLPGMTPLGDATVVATPSSSRSDLSSAGSLQAIPDDHDAGGLSLGVDDAESLAEQATKDE
jgi:hypothetical protein